jgi:hypothetical protein
MAGFFTQMDKISSLVALVKHYCGVLRTSQQQRKKELKNDMPMMGRIELTVKSAERHVIRGKSYGHAYGTKE